jgi:hypothetical protein
VYGYKAGCDFALGSVDVATAQPLAARFLCRDDGIEGCLYDGSGSGTCKTDSTMNGFAVVAPVRPLEPLSLPCLWYCYLDCYHSPMLC